MSHPTLSARRTGASIGIIGGGIFGVSAAWELAARGHAVTLYETREDILSGTTSRNFFRVHRGYHYPRDLPTARAARAGYQSFTEIFSAAFTAATPHYYAIAATGSLTTVEQFEKHCQQVGLRARRIRPSELVPRSVVACYEVDEAYYDTIQLRKLAWERLLSARVRIELKSVRKPRDIARTHDFVVVAAYGSLNEILLDLDCPPIELQYEICEVPVVHTPDLNGLSLVVLDGPFVSIAPYGNNCHALYDVVHTVHARYVGHTSPGFRGYPQDLVATHALPPGLTKFSPIMSSTRRFVEPLSNGTHVGSHFAERVVMPGLDATDARPTLVRWAGPSVISVLSGKVSTSIDSARTVTSLIATRMRQDPAG